MVRGAPEGWHSITARVFVEDPAALVTFLRAAFSATGHVNQDRPAEVQIGDSMLMVSGVGPRPATTAFLYLYVEDADATYERAMAAGAIPSEAPVDTPYGDRRCTVIDPAGNVWQIATRRAPA